MTTTGIYTATYPKFSLEFHFSATPGDPGNTSGPPERCYEPTPDELEISEIFLVIPGKEKLEISSLDLLEELDVDVEWVYDKIWETLRDADIEPDPPEEDFDYFDEEGNRLP
jgi:hypothetical protein